MSKDSHYTLDDIFGSAVSVDTALDTFEIRTLNPQDSGLAYQKPDTVQGSTSNARNNLQLQDSDAVAMHDTALQGTTPCELGGSRGHDLKLGNPTEDGTYAESGNAQQLNRSDRATVFDVSALPPPQKGNAWSFEAFLAVGPEMGTADELPMHTIQEIPGNTSTDFTPLTSGKGRVDTTKLSVVTLTLLDEQTQAVGVPTSDRSAIICSVQLTIPDLDAHTDSRTMLWALINMEGGITKRVLKYAKYTGFDMTNFKEGYERSSRQLEMVAYGADGSRWEAADVWVGSDLCERRCHEPEQASLVHLTLTRDANGKDAKQSIYDGKALLWPHASVYRFPTLDKPLIATLDRLKGPVLQVPLNGTTYSGARYRIHRWEPLGETSIARVREETGQFD